MATQTARERLWRGGTITYVAARISLTDPSTKRDSAYTTTPGASPVLYLCDKGQSEDPQQFNHGRGLLYNVDGDEKYYYPYILDWGVQHQEHDDQGGIVPGRGLIVVANKRVAWQEVVTESDPLFVRLSQLRSQYLWNNARIELLLATGQYDYSPDPSVGVQFHEHKAQRIFYGRVSRVRGPINGRLEIEFGEDLSWDRVVPDIQVPGGGSAPAIITKKDYANAPPEFIGSSIPMVFNSRGVDETVGRTPAVNTTLLDGLSPCVVTEQGGSTSRALRIFCNKWASHGGAPSAFPSELFIYYPDSGLVGVLDSTQSTTSTTEVYFDLDHITTAQMFIPANRYLSHSGATNPERSVDGRPDTYTTLTNGQWVMHRVPFVGPYGQAVSMQTFCMIEAGSVGAGALNTTPNVEFGLWNDNTGTWHAPSGTPLAANPRQLTKAQLNAGVTTLRASITWATGVNEWDDPDKPMSAWRWEWPSGLGLRENLYFRLQVIEPSVTCRLISGGIYLGYFPTKTPNSNFTGFKGGSAAFHNVGGTPYGGLYGRTPRRGSGTGR